jgi:hypothetical protein
MNDTDTSNALAEIIALLKSIDHEVKKIAAEVADAEKPAP